MVKINKSNILLIIVIILGCLLRLINFDKQEGLWNDEYVSWFVASTPLNNGFWTEIFKQCHMPLYYFYLKPFCGCRDVVLRFTSFIPSVFSILVLYFTGKSFSEKAGITAAFITSVLSFLVYYAQEVRLYSLVFLFSALVLLFTIRLLKAPNKFNLIGYIASGILLVFTHVLGIIYFFFNTLYLVYKKKKIPLQALVVLVIVSGILTFLGIKILSLVPYSQWWGRFSYTNILFLFSDFFSPILTNNINAPDRFFYNKSPLFNMLITLPTILALTGISLGAKRANGILITALFTIITMIVLALTGKIVFITKYSIEILPVLILLLSIGFEKKTILTATFILFHLIAVFTPYYTAKLFRFEGHKLVGDIINTVEPDKIIYTYYEPDRFSRYINKEKPNFYISKRNRIFFINDVSECFKIVNPGERVSVIFLDSVSFIPPNMIEQAEKTEIPEMFITFSKIKYLLIKELNNNFKDLDIKQSGSWTVITGTKVK